jgi:starvation-inducible DNA-binding protein
MSEKTVRTQRNQSCVTKQFLRRHTVLLRRGSRTECAHRPQDSQKFSKVTQDSRGREAHSCRGVSLQFVGDIAMPLKSRPDTNGHAGDHSTDPVRLATPHFNQHAIEMQPYGTSLRYPIALDDKIRLESISVLNQLLADTMTLRDLYKKHHWQVSGATFNQLHLLFDKHYQEHLTLIDAIAERVQILGGISIAMAADVAEMTVIPRPPRGREEVPVQLSRLLAAHEMVILQVRRGAKKAAALGDEGTNDLLVSNVLRTHEMQVWILSEHLVSAPLTLATR